MDLISDRRALHRIPELDRNLPETLGYLRSALEALPCAVFSPAESALCAFFDFGRDHSLAFRADMDALPVSEANETIHKWQKKVYEEYGYHFIHAGDEWYILAGYEMPEEERYDGYLQLENGVGMIRLLQNE